MIPTAKELLLSGKLPHLTNRTTLFSLGAFETPTHETDRLSQLTPHRHGRTVGVSFLLCRHAILLTLQRRAYDASRPCPSPPILCQHVSHH